MLEIVQLGQIDVGVQALPHRQGIVEKCQGRDPFVLDVLAQIGRGVEEVHAMGQGGLDAFGVQIELAFLVLA